MGVHDIIKTKKCTKCGVEHTGTLEELHKYFNWNNKAKRTLTSMCRVCDNKRTREHRAKYKERYNRISREWATEHKDRVATNNRRSSLAIKAVNCNFKDVTDEELLELQDRIATSLKEIKKEIKFRRI